MLEQIRSAESSLAAALRQATAGLSAAAGPDLDAALDDLQKAADGAKARLDAVADKARGVLLRLADGYAAAARQLAADLSGLAATDEAEAPAAETLPEPVTMSAVIEPLTLLNPDADHESQPSSDAVSAEVEAIAAGEGWTETVSRLPLPDRTARLVEALALGAGPVPSLQEVEAQINARHQEKPRPAPSSNGKAPRKRKG